MNEDLDKNLKAVMTIKMGLSTNAQWDVKPAIDNEKLLRPDLIIRDGNRSIIIEINKRIDIQSISRLTLFQKYLKNNNFEFIIASIIIPDKIRELADKVGIDVIQIPPGVRIKDHTKRKRPRGRFTSNKSWKILTRVMIEGITSIRNVSKKENISYAWTHKTMTSMIELGVMEKDGDLIKLVDIEKALNITAFERPFNDLKIGEINIPDNMDTKELSNNLHNWNIEHAFTGYTAASAFTGYGFRHDSVLLYVKDRSSFRLLKDIFSDQKGKFKLIIYLPDRDVFSDSLVMNDITFVSPDQALMDMAGLGYSGMDLTLQMVKNYANIRSDH